MNISIDTFIEKYSKAILQGKAAVFAGAGLSVNSGYVDWKEFLRDIASEIDLDIDKENDLISVAQYYKNAVLGRWPLNQEILNTFTHNVSDNKLMNILANLPIKTYWTTNYDHIIENTISRIQGTEVDVKITQEDLATNIANSEVTVYKFHGDVSSPSSAVLTRDDYELFEITHKLFITSLQGDLINNTFVFIGYSFNDPNFRQILSKIRILLGENQRMHYFITKKVERTEFEDKEDYLYACTKQELRLQDLNRYSIFPVLVDKYEQIPEIFERIQRRCTINNIFIAGSCRNYGEWKTEVAYQFMYSLGYKLVSKRFKISTGLIEGVGPQIANGALNAIHDNNLKIDQYLSIKTLPLINGSDEHMNKDSKKMFQTNMINEAGIVLFLFGNKYYNGTLSSSRGVFEDFTMAKENKKYIIPVGATGFAALDIQNELEKNKSNYPYLEGFWDDLKDSSDINKLINTILNIIDNIIISL